MRDHDADSDEAARWFLKEHEAMWTQWVPEEVAAKVKESLK